MTPSMRRTTHSTPERIFITQGDEAVPALLALVKAASGQWLLLRHYHHAERDALAAWLAQACRAQRVRLLVAGDARLALRVGAQGVHYPSHQLGQPNRRPHRNWHVSAAIHHARDIIAAQHSGADWGLLAPIFAAPSGGRLLHPVRVAALAQTAPFPLLALGGMDESKMRRLRATNIQGWGGIRGGYRAAARFSPAKAN